MSLHDNYNKKQPVYWENTSGGHQKFWAASILQERNGEYILVRKWGKIGTKGQSMEQTFNTLYTAKDALRKLIWDKENKGYKGKF